MQHHGYMLVITPSLWGGDDLEEYDIVICAHGHCGGRIIRIRPGIPVHRCTCCDKLICDTCVGKGCMPLEKKLLEWESRAALSKAMGG